MDLISIAQVASNAPTAADFSFVALFKSADWVVKSVMIMLVIASLWSWAIAIDKLINFYLLKKRADDFEKTFWSARKLEDLSEGLVTQSRDPMGKVFAAAMREYNETKSMGVKASNDFMGARGRIDKVMNLVVSRELTRAESGLTVLATIGSAAVFVGLFGTVWGIINAFRNIATTGDVNLTVVAPGIAEALFVTALGLIAAIPAVIFYNKFSSDVGKYAVRLEGYADELSAILSRKISKGS